MRTNRTIFSRHPRRGTVSLEVVMTTAIMLPLAGILFFLGLDMLKALYQAIGTMVSWPFL